MVLQMKGEPGPRVMHKNPPCPQFTRLQGHAFYRWLLTGDEVMPDDDNESLLAQAYEEVCGEKAPPPAPLNRRQRRAQKGLSRGQMPKRPLPRRRPR